MDRAQQALGGQRPHSQLTQTERWYADALVNNGRPGDLFGSRELEILERPWVGGTTGDLLSRMILDADFAGNSYTARVGSELVRRELELVRKAGKPVVVAVHANHAREFSVPAFEALARLAEAGVPLLGAVSCTS